MRRNSTHSLVQHVLAIALAAPASLMIVAVGCTAPAAEVEPEADTGGEEGNVSEAPEELSSCNYYNYHHDEIANWGGPGVCSSDCDCDGMRTCRSGRCGGEARPAVSCTSTAFRWNEAWNPQGPSKCSSHCECDGARTCSWPYPPGYVQGYCQGTAR